MGFGLWSVEVCRAWKMRKLHETEPKPGSSTSRRLQLTKPLCVICPLSHSHIPACNWITQSIIPTLLIHQFFLFLLIHSLVLPSCHHCLCTFSSFLAVWSWSKVMMPETLKKSKAIKKDLSLLINIWSFQKTELACVITVWLKNSGKFIVVFGKWGLSCITELWIEMMKISRWCWRG